MRLASKIIIITAILGFCGITVAAIWELISEDTFFRVTATGTVIIGLGLWVEMIRNA